MRVLSPLGLIRTYLISLFSLPHLVAAVLVTPALVLVLPGRNPEGAQVGATFLEKEIAHLEYYHCQDLRSYITLEDMHISLQSSLLSQGLSIRIFFFNSFKT